MAERKKITDAELKTIIKAEIANCNAGSQLSNERTENLDYYFGRPFGNEQEGRSQVVSTDVCDTIEWILPSLIRIFTSGEDVVEFDPQGPEDVAVAKQATEYVNFIWNRDNRGFLTFYTWFKDALLSKNGVVKIYWEENEVTKRERYTGLDDTAFAKIVNDKNVEVSEHTENEELVEGKPLKTHDLVVTRKRQEGRVCVDPVPPEEFLITRDARDVQIARLAGHKRKRTISDLLESGFPKDKVNRLPEDDETHADGDQEAVTRDTVAESDEDSSAPANNAMREVWVTEAYIKVDVDGDGIAEMRKVTVAGNGCEILSNDAWDAPRPFADLTPIIMPHRRNGRAVADLVKDLQLIKSTILRQYLDNLYLSNNQREEVVESNIIEPSEVLSTEPGRKIRVKAVDSVRPIVVPNIGAQALEGLTYLDRVKENRTGVSERTQGLGANQLHDTAEGERLLMTAAQGKIELIARVFAETGVRDAFRMILKLICMYQQEARVIRLTDQWVPMDPASWNSDMDMTVSVGLGMGDRDQQLQHALLLGRLQAEALKAGTGMVTPDNLMATAELAINAMGMKDVNRFFTKPDPNKPPPPDPQMAKVQQEGQIKQQQTQADIQMKLAEMQQKFQLQMTQLRAELGLKQQEMYMEADLEREKMAMTPQIEGIRASAKISSGVQVGGEPG